MIKNNLWNRIFHSNKIKDFKKKIKEYHICTLFAEELLNKVQEAESLEELVSLHKEAHKRYVHITKPEWMFRTKDISTLVPSLVYLGNIYGLPIKFIPYYIARKTHKIGNNTYGLNPETTLYSIVLNQYKELLKFNINKQYQEALKIIKDLKKYGY